MHIRLVQSGENRCNDESGCVGLTYEFSTQGGEMLKSWPTEDRIRYVELRLREIGRQKRNDPKEPSRRDHQIWLLKEKGDSWRHIADECYQKHMNLSARKSAAVRARGRVERYYTNGTLTPESKEVLENLFAGVKIVFVQR